MKGKIAPVTYTYELSEKKGDPAHGLIYDETVYTITVTLTDDGEGNITPSATVADTELVNTNNMLSGLDFNNRSVGNLKVTKEVETNAATSVTDYELTITLENATYPLAGVWQVYDANDVSRRARALPATPRRPSPSNSRMANTSSSPACPWARSTPSPSPTTPPTSSRP